MPGHQKFKKKCKDLPILSNLDGSCRNLISIGEFFSEYAIISEYVEKSVLRIRACLNIPLSKFAFFFGRNIVVIRRVRILRDLENLSNIDC